MDAVVDPGGIKEENELCTDNSVTITKNSNLGADTGRLKIISDHNEDDFNSSTGELEMTNNSSDESKTNCRKQYSAPQIDINQLHSEPDFAAVCSFFNKFNVLIGIKSITFTKLENILTSFDIEGRVNKELVDLHLTLMRRVRMSSVRAETWENYLMKFLATNDMLQGELFQLERYGYVHLPVASKIQILKALCEAQFDFNPKLKENIVATCKAFDLRLIPLGMDKSGLSYWFQQDSEHNIRFYTEEQDDQSGVTWTLVARSAEELENLIVKLKTEDLGYKRKDNDGKGEEKAVQTDLQEGSMVMSTKKGTFIDICYDEAMIKKMREAIIKQKEERKNKREKKGEVEKDEGCGEEDEEKPEVDEDMEDWTDRRVMPRRNASQRAVTNIKKYAKKSGDKKKKKKEEDNEGLGKEENNEEKDTEKSESTSGSDSESGEEGDSFDSNDGDDLGAGSSDDEFMPKSVRKSLGKRRRRDVKKKKKKLDLDDMDEEDEDSDEEEEQKERKKATEETSCGQCKTSGDWDVLLLCDVCDDAWHTYCLKPMLWYVPDGDWFCPKCVHGMLIEKLEEVAKCLDFHLKKKLAEDKRKKAAADRLRREMEYIGVSLNNIIPTTLKQSALPSSSSSTESEDDGQRRCKKKAVKRIAPKSKFQREVMMTIAEGRSRRKTKQVDYNFSEYDSVIQEACEEMGDVNPNEREGEMVRPQGGAGRGKDMANIIEAEKKRKGSVDSTVDGTVVEGVDRDRTSQMGKPARSAPKPRRKLNDLNIDNRSDSDSEEYKASESEEEEADAEEIDSESDYVPSDEQKRTRRGGPRGGLARTQSDDDFVVSGSDDDEESDYRGKRKKIVDKKIKKKGRWEPSESDSEEEESYGYSDDSEVDRKRKKKEGAKGRWKAKESSEESDAPRTKTGRPLRRAVARSETKKVIVSDSEDNEDEGDKEKQGDGPVGPLDKQRKRKIESDSDEEEFKPDEEEEEEAENYEDESEEDEESIEKETEDDSRDVHDVIRKKGLEDDDSNDSNDLDLKPKVKKRKAANDIGSSKKITQKLTSKTEPSDLSDKTNGPGKLHAKKETPVQEIGPPLTVVSVKKEFTTPNQPLPTREVERKPVISSLPIPAPVSVAAMPNPYAAPGHYPPPPNPYYQGPSPVSGIHMPPYSMPNPYPSPYHQGPHPQFRPGPYAPPRVDIQHGYPTQIHNPYGQPPTSLPPGENGLRDLRSL